MEWQASALSPYVCRKFDAAISALPTSPTMCSHRIQPTCPSLPPWLLTHVTPSYFTHTSLSSLPVCTRLDETCPCPNLKRTPFPSRSGQPPDSRPSFDSPHRGEIQCPRLFAISFVFFVRLGFVVRPSLERNYSCSTPTWSQDPFYGCLKPRMEEICLQTSEQR